MAYILSFFVFSYKPRSSPLSFPLQLYSNFVKLFISNSGAFRLTLTLIRSRLAGSLYLLVLALPLSLLMGISLGVFAASRYGKASDRFLTALATLFCAIPIWWLGFSLMLLLCGELGIFPIHGYYDYVKWAHPLSLPEIPFFLVDLLRHLAVPTLSFVLGLFGFYYIMARSSVVDIVSRDFVRLAKAKGLSIREIMFKHVLRNALPSVIMMVSVTPLMISTGLVLLEVTCSKPGFGWIIYRFMIMHKENRLVLQVLFLLFTVLMIVLGLIAEVTCYLLDPRIANESSQESFNFSVNIVLPKFSLRKPSLYLNSFRRMAMAFRRDGRGIVGLGILAALILLSLLGYFNEVSLSEPCLPPSFSHPLGTDEWGRDVLIRLLKGGMTSLSECLGAVFIAMMVGCLVGLISGYYHGSPFSYALDRITDLFISMPIIIFVSVFPMSISIPIIHPMILRSMLLTGLSSWGITARLVKSKVVIARGHMYVEAARAMGSDDWHIMLHHVLPEAFRTALSSIIYVAAIATTVQSGLDFLGYRRYTYSTIEEVRSAPIISWGNMIAYSTMYGRTFSHMWWCILPPAICLTLLILALVLICDCLADVLNPPFARL